MEKVIYESRGTPYQRLTNTPAMIWAVAMHYALSHPTRLDKLVVVDISPTDRDLSSEFGSYIAAMRNVEQARVKNKDEADKLLARTIEVRQYYLWEI